VINGGTGDAVRIVGAGGVSVSNLVILGSGANTNRRGSGVVVRKAGDVRLDAIEVSGFQHAGIVVIGSRGVRITQVYAHDNGFAGILTGYPREGERSRDVYIGHCRALNNPGFRGMDGNVSGSGICCWDIDGGLIEYCEAAYNGWDKDIRAENGPVGIWLAFCRSVVIQHCVSHDNRSTTGDGGGFDFDSGCHDCLMQYNYSYGNAGCGYLLCPYLVTPDHSISNCTVRFCVSENDGQQSHNTSLFAYNGTNQWNIQIYNNIFYNEAGRGCVGSRPALPASFAFRNNLFITRGNGQFVRNMGDAVFQGNVYWNPDGPGNWDGASTLEAWRQKGYELLDGAPVGFFADPQLAAPGRGEKLTNPADIPKLKAYALLAWSPLMGAGLDLRSRFGLEIGAYDLYGHALPPEGPWPVGADASTEPLKVWREEYNATSAETPAEWKTLPNPLPTPFGPWLFRRDPTEQGLKDEWFALGASTADWIPVKVPGFWAETRVVGNYQGYGWYRTTFTVPEAWQGKGLRILFAAIDEEAWVYLNGKLVREHSVKSEGKSIGALWDEPFAADAPAAILNYGMTNVLAVRVGNSLGNGGIWRPVLGHAIEEQ
jgi:hypothetical protein